MEVKTQAAQISFVLNGTTLNLISETHWKHLGMKNTCMMLLSQVMMMNKLKHTGSFYPCVVRYSETFLRTTNILIRFFT